jgi:taurine dioxygenase
MEFVKLSPALGAEVKGVESGEWSQEQIDELRAAVDEHCLLLIRGVQITSEEQVELSESLFGPASEHEGDKTYLFTNRAGGLSAAKGRLLFHSDFLYTDRPMTGITNYGLELPRSGASTLYANAVLACATLPDALRAEVEDREAVSVYGEPNSVPGRDRDEDTITQRAVHPVLFVHPRTGERILFVTDLATRSIVGMTAEHSRAVLDALVAHIERPEHCYEHHWQPHDIVIWDNLALQHGRREEATSGVRTLRKVGHR